MVEKLNTQNWWSNQGKNIGNINQQTQEVICRVFSRRHGITKVEEQYWTEEKQMPNILMGDNGKKEMERLAEEMLASGCKAEDTVIVYSPKDEEGNKVRRIIQSKNILQSKLQCAAIETNLLNTWVKIQDKEGKVDNKADRIVGKLKHAADVAELARHEILGAFNGKWWAYDKYKNIILLSHKSNEPWLDVISTPEAKTVTLSKHKEKWNHDDDIVRDGNGKAEYKNYKDEKEVLQITNENKEKLMRYFENEKWLCDEICRCEEKGYNIFELQNAVNKYFNKQSELYERYLASEDENLRIFCLAKLIDAKKYENIIIFIKGRLKSFSIQEQRDVFDIVKKENSILEKFLQIFFEDKQESNEYNNLKSYMIEELIKLWEDQILLMNYYENIYPLVKDIKEKSLDMRIVNWEDIYPEFNLEGKITNSKINNMIKEIKEDNMIKKIEKGIMIKKIIYSDINIFMKEIHNISHYPKWADEKILYIEANSGTGKSFLLSRINEKIKNMDFMMDGVINNLDFGIDKSKIFPIFINLSWEGSVKSIKDKIQSIQNNYKRPKCGKNSIVILDSLDESNFNDEQRKELLTYLANKSELPSDVIITSRRGYISKDKSDDNRWDTLKKIDIVQIKEMDDINVDTYVKEYFWNKNDSSKKTEEFNRYKNNERFHGIEKNPLILSMICYLIEKWNDIKNIASIWDLYEKIVDLRLRYRESKKNKPWRKILVDQENEEEIQGILNKRKEFLWELAYQEVLEWKRMDEINFSILKKKYLWIIPDNDCLNLLFRKNDNNKEYEFIHQSFKDYFLLKWFENDCNEEWKIKKECLMKYNKEKLKTLWFKSIQEWYTNTVELLIKNWCDLLIQRGEWMDEFSRDGFMTACQFWHKDVVKLLIEKFKNININKRDSLWYNVFMIACEFWHKDMAELLTENFKNYNSENIINDFWLNWLADKLEYFDTEYDNIDGIERWKKIQGFLEWSGDITWLLLEKLHNYLLIDNKKKIKFSSKEISERLLKHYKTIDIDHKEKHNWENAFMIASWNWHKDIAERLADKIIDINAADKYWMSNFMYACMYWNKWAVEKLYNRGVDINAINDKWMNAFMIACKCWRKDIVEFLYDKIDNISTTEYDEWMLLW